MPPADAPTPRVDIRSVLITGATGYLGSRLATACMARGDVVHALTRSGEGPRGATAHRYDGTFASVDATVRSAKPDVVFHLAAVGKADHAPAEVDAIVQPGVMMGAQLCEACSASGSSLILAGSYWEYGPDGSPLPNSLYAAVKGAARDLARWYARACGLRAIELALFDVYGPDDPRPKLLPTLVSRLGSSDAMPMTGGEQRLDPVHADDAVDAFLIAADLAGRLAAGEMPTFAVRGGEPRTLREIVALLEEVAGGHVPARWGALAYPRHQVFELPLSIPSPPGFTPRKTLRAGLGELVARRGGGYPSLSSAPRTI